MKGIIILAMVFLATILIMGNARPASSDEVLENKLYLPVIYKDYYPGPCGSMDGVIICPVLP